MLMLYINRKSYIRSPITPLDLTFNDLNKLKLRLFRLRQIVTREEAELDRLLLISTTRKLNV